MDLRPPSEEEKDMAEDMMEDDPAAPEDDDIRLEPRAGIEFGSLPEAYSFYQEYGRSNGFNTAIQNSRRSKVSRDFIDAKFACARYGTRRGRPGSEPASGRKSCIKTNCKASMHVKMKNGTWFVHRFDRVHNHELLPAQAVSEQTRDMFAAMARQLADQYKKSSEKAPVDPAMEASEAKCLLDFYTHMQSLNSNFFYAVDVGDQDQRLGRFFWVDAKSRHDYGDFSDVVCLDTSYVRNKYKIPLVLFLGVNQHYQCILLGCALVSDETEPTYSWVMRTWLKAMGGQAPRVFLTDQGTVFKSTVPEIFPASSHYFSLRQIMGKVTETKQDDESFLAKFDKCVHRSWVEEEFERRWLKLVDRFELRENELMQSLYEDRAKWVPFYFGVGDICFAGMSTVINRSPESRFLHEKSGVREFISRYEAMLQERYEEEAKADSDTWSKQPVLKSLSPFEKHAATIYTHAVFKRFQVEVMGAVACIPKRDQKRPESSSTMMTFRVADFEKVQEFAVTWNEVSSEVSCTCRLFEYEGYLCRHALIVLQSCGISTIPSRYTLRRWSRDAGNNRFSDVGDGAQQLQSRVQRYNDLCQRAMKLGEVGSLSQQRYNIALDALDGALRNCFGVDKSPAEDDNQTRGKGKGKAKAVKKRKDKLSSSSRQSVPQQSVPGTVQLNSMAPTLDSMYANQQSMQGLGQLDSTVEPSHDSFGGSQQAIDGLVHDSVFWV